MEDFWSTVFVIVFVIVFYKIGKSMYDEKFKK